MGQHDKNHQAAAPPDFHSDDGTFANQQSNARAVHTAKPASALIAGRARNAAGVVERDEDKGLTLAEREALEEAKRASALAVDVDDIPVTPEAEAKANSAYLSAQDAALATAVGTAPWQLDSTMAAVTKHMAEAEDKVVDFVTGKAATDLGNTPDARISFRKQLGAVIQGPGQWFAVSSGLEKFSNIVAAGGEDSRLVAMVTFVKSNGTDALARAA